MKRALRFCLMGLLIAGLEEFITQGVLKRNFIGWILPTLVAFVPFTILTGTIGWCLNKTLSEPGALVIHYLTAGGIGLLVEWFLIGLSPWSDPKAPVVAMFAFQFGMFSFWGGVAFLPRLLLDDREVVSRVRSACKRFLIGGFVLLYVLTFAVPKDIRFPVSIGTVLLLFIGLNLFYARYLRAMLKRPEDGNDLIAG